MQAKISKNKCLLKKAEFQNSFYFCKLLWNRERVSEHIFEGNWYDTQNECIWDYTHRKSSQNEFRCAFMYFKRPVYFTSNLLISMLSAFINAKISMSLLKKRSYLGVLLKVDCFFSLQWMIPLLLIYYSFPGSFPFWSIAWFLLVTSLFKKVQMYSPVPILCLFRVFASGTWVITFNNSSNNYILEILSRVHATVMVFFT